MMAKNPRNKFGARRTRVGGVVLDSKREALRWVDLQLLQRAGAISDLKRQVKVELIGQNGPLLTRTGRKMRITFDFGYFENGRQIYEDAKGYPTRDYEVRVAVARAMGLEIRET